MRQVSLVTGQAGTGKTSWLASEVLSIAPATLADEKQRVLAVTRMHGARRRIDVKFAESCPAVPISVSTIHSFALSLVNKWRTALGHSRPIQISSGGADFQESTFGVEATFDGILREATALLRHHTVGTLLGRTYPLIVIDEFQDCHGLLLELVKSISSWSRLLLAADDFQLLDTDVSGCPAMDWVRQGQAAGFAHVHDLGMEQHRFTGAIERAAHALRKDERSATQTVPVVSCPKAPLAAWKIISNVALWGRWRGTTAVITTSGDDSYARDVLQSCESQLRRRGEQPISWSSEKTGEADQNRVLHQARKLLNGETANDNTDPLAIAAVERSERYALLRGMGGVTDELLVRKVEAIVHERRAYQPSNRPKAVLTIYGAKNREFDNVFVLWGYKIPSSSAVQRRLLYNAVTRAKKNCMVLVLDPDGHLKTDPVLQLLGPPESAIPKKESKKKAKTPRATQRSKAAWVKRQAT